MHRKIQIKRSRKGTFARFFNNLMSAADAGTETVSFLVTDLTGTPLRIVDSDEQALFSRNADNNFFFDNSLKILTGRTSSQMLNSELTFDQQDNIRKNFTDKQFAAFGKKSVSAVFFEQREVSDFFVDLGIMRSCDILDTLSVHNNVIGEIPTLESTTGVLFGRLEAIQKIKNENGEKIRIPLANVPVAIFNSSEEFPTISSASPDGNRIALNIKENSDSNLYFNQESFETDQAFLQDDSAFGTVPQKFKYTAVTNERGEFAIFDVPVGEQVFMFEIDLLKQGLSKDEVALNFFPYPSEESPIIDNIPSFFFRQIPVNIVPAWGDFQSGYTELNITVPLDLRKWSTYYASPISFADVTLQERQNKGYSTPLSFAVRDMTREGFPLRRLELVEIDDLLKKDSEQQLMWDSEFKQIKNKAEFRANDFQAFKLPANLYDPEGIGTNGLKGVWLCAYQIKMFYQGNQVYRVTGFERNYVPAPVFTTERSHFDLNRHTNSNDPLTFSATTGVFPYEKPWTINYPIKYSIPKIPTQLNLNKQYDSGGAAISFKEPKWVDGDRVGGPLYNEPSSGYGLQIMDGKFKPNLFSQRVSAGVIFKYENGVSWEEQYSNGFHPVLDGTVGNESQVLEGEKYQRLEAGYGYWLRPEGWPRISNNNWGDTILTGDFDSRYSNPVGLSPSTYRDAVFKATPEIITIKFDDTSSVRKGTLDIYRVADPKLLVEPGPPLVEKFVDIEFQEIYVQNGHTPGRASRMILDSEQPRMHLASGVGHISVTNTGIITVTINGVKIGQGETGILNETITSNMSLTLPGNASYDSTENSYNTANYHIRLYDVQIEDVVRELGINVGLAATKTTAVYYATSRLDSVGVFARVKDNGDIKCNTEFLQNKDVLINGIAFLAGGGSSVNYISLGSQITADCSEQIPIKFPA